MDLPSLWDSQITLSLELVVALVLESLATLRSDLIGESEDDSWSKDLELSELDDLLSSPDDVFNEQAISITGLEMGFWIGSGAAGGVYDTF